MFVLCVCVAFTFASATEWDFIGEASPEAEIPVSVAFANQNLDWLQVNPNPSTFFSTF